MVDYCNRYSLPALPAIVAPDGTVIPPGSIAAVAEYTNCVGPERRKVAPGYESNFIAELAFMQPKERREYLAEYLPHSSPELCKRLEFEFAETVGDLAPPASEPIE